jgi:hypothetical protein
MHVIRLPVRAALAPPRPMRRSDRAAVHAVLHRRARADAASMIGRDDWASLFDAVVVQLRHTVEVRPDVGLGARIPDAGRVRARVLECVAALELLRAASAPGDAGRGALRLTATHP